MAFARAIQNLLNPWDAKFREFPEDLTQCEASTEVANAEDVDDEFLVINEAPTAYNTDGEKKSPLQSAFDSCPEKYPQFVQLRRPEAKDYPQHEKVYGTAKQQIKLLCHYLEDPDIAQDIKAIALKSILINGQRVEGVHLAIQVFKFAEKGLIADYQHAQQCIVAKLAEKYAASRDDLIDIVDECKWLLVQHCLPFLAYQQNEEPGIASTTLDANSESVSRQKPPSFAVTAQWGEITFKDAELFMKMVRAHLSPRVLHLALLSDRIHDDEELRQMLCCGISHSTSTYTFPFESQCSDYPTNVNNWSPFATADDLEMFPRCNLHETHPHRYMALAVEAINQCKYFQEWCVLLNRLLYEQKYDDHEFYQLLVLEFKYKLIVLKEVDGFFIRFFYISRMSSFNKCE